MKTSDGFVRQVSNPGASLNTDNTGLAAYKLRKQRESEINTLKDDVKEVKDLLNKLLEKLK
jgi:hypothetical protein